MAVTRTYACDECEWVWTQFHHDSREPYPGCPKCEAHSHWVPANFNITTTKAKAVDMAQKIAEEDYGLTDMRDNLREGDTVVKGPPPVQTSEAEALTHMMVEQAQQLGHLESISAEQAGEQVKAFWQNPGGMTGTTAAAMGAAGAATARAENNDPVGNLHAAAARAHGQLPQGAPAAATMNLQVLSRADPSKLA